MEIEPNSSIKNSLAIIRYLKCSMKNHPDASEFMCNSCAPSKRLCILFETSKSYVLKTADGRLVVKVYMKEPHAVVNEAFICGKLATERSDLFPAVIGTFHNDTFGIIIFKDVGLDAFEILSASTYRASALTTSFSTGLTEAVDVLHDHGWTHRDIKLENIVYCETEQKWRLIDFGLAVQHGTDTRPAGTPPLFIPYENETITHAQRIDSDRYAAAMTILSFVGVIYPHKMFCEHCIQNTKNSICFVGGICKQSNLFRINIEYMRALANQNIILPPRVSDHPKLVELISLSASVVLAALYPFRFYKYLAWNSRTCKWETYAKHNGRVDSSSSDVHAAWQRLRQASMSHVPI